MTAWLRMEILITLPLLLQLLGVSLAVYIDPYIKKKHRNVMLINAGIILTLIIQNYAGYLIDLDGHMIYMRTIVGIYGYSLRPVVILLFFYIVDEDRNYRLFWYLAALNVFIHLTALFSGICFYIDGNNRFHRGPLGYSCHTISAVFLVYLLYISYSKYSRLRKREFIIPIINALLIIVAVVFDGIVDYRLCPVTFMMITVVSGTVFYYIWLHLQFVREHEKALKAEQRIQIMMTQIQPHFLYNTLSTIQALCKKDPDKAFEVTEKFGTYLRQNLNSLNQTSLVPVEKEIEHTRIYADIEMVRFPSIKVMYDISDRDFSLPALTIQPLVENSIRHGVRGKDEGIVKVLTVKKDGSHEIVIEDNGTGFDVEEMEKSDSTHIGLRNVKERIESMCGGTLMIESVRDSGTKITIKIPPNFERGG